MGCDIHIITQIRKESEWETVDEIPKNIAGRDYTTFAFLAGIRNSFKRDGFEPKGLPDDLKEKKFRFISYQDEMGKRYNNETVSMVRMPDGSLRDSDDEIFWVGCKSQKEAEKDGRRWKYTYENGYSYFDCGVVGGTAEEITYKDLMTFEEFSIQHYGDSWNQERKEYGRYEVDFDCPDYHTPSWLTLQELVDKDKTQFFCMSAKIPFVFYKAFVSMGGVMPEKMIVVKPEDRNFDDMTGFQELLQYAFHPDVIVRWHEDETVESEMEKEIPIFKGINELKEIAEKYGVDYKDIRIVFAFDN